MTDSNEPPATDDDLELDDGPPPTFAELGVDKRLVDTLAERNITVPTPIQALSIGPALEGHNVCGKAKTGSGKTIAFGLPTLMHLDKGQARQPTGVVLVPTRELAQQVASELEDLAEAVERSVVCIHGGVSMKGQVDALRAGADLVVATPGRLIDLCDQGEADLSQVEDVLIDEADRMADMGFLPQVEWVLRQMPDRTRTLLFSATLDGEVRGLVNAYVKEHVTAAVSESAPTVDAMHHLFLLVHGMDRDKVVATICEHTDKVIVFCRTKRGASSLCQALSKLGIDAAEIHGDRRQSEREKALERFTDGRLPVLVATDVAARGIHVDDVNVVIHYDPPENHKTYLHRSGRTARAGASGVAVTFVLWDQELEVRRLKRRLQLDDLPIVRIFSNDDRLHDLAAFADALEAGEA